MTICEAAGPVKFARINENTAAANEIIAADSQGRAIRILGLVLSNNNDSTAVVVTVQDDTSPTPNVLIGPLGIGAGETVVLPANGLGYGEGAAGKAIDLVSDGTEVVGGSVTYQYVGSRGPAA